MIDFGAGYDSRWRMMRVDKDTWADIEEVPSVSELSIKRSCTDDVPLLEQGSATVTLPYGTEFETGWYRIEMLAKQGGSYERYPLATLLFEGYSSTDDIGVDSYSLNGYSVLKPVSDKKTILGEYLNKGMDGAQWVHDILRESVPKAVQIEVEGSFEVSDYYVFDPNTSYLEAVWNVLDAASWCLMIDGYGNITIRANPTQSSLVLDKANASMLLPKISKTLDIADVPNRYYVINGDEYAVAINDDEDSRTSYARRGWYKDEIEENPVRVNGESLQGCAERLLMEASTLVKTYSYQREFYPDIVPFSIVTGRLPDHINADLRVMSQQLDCGSNGVIIQEEAGEEIREWRGPNG